MGCGLVRPVKSRGMDGPTCGTCARADPQTWRQCVGCGRARPVNQHTPEGPLCLNCYKQRRPTQRWPGSPVERRTDQAAVIVTTVRATDPKISGDQALTAVNRVANHPIRRAVLAVSVSTQSGPGETAKTGPSDLMTAAC